MPKKAKISKKKIDEIMSKLKNGDVCLTGGYVTDQSWSVGYEDGKFIERGWNVDESFELKLSEDEVKAKLRFFGEKIVKEN